jgi:hypothetical protein
MDACVRWSRRLLCLLVPAGLPLTCLHIGARLLLKLERLLGVEDSAREKTAQQQWYRKQHPEKRSNIDATRATAPELALATRLLEVET